MRPQTPALEGTPPKGYLTFKAIKQVDGDRITYVGAMPVFDLIDKGFVVPVASAGLSPEILSLVATNGPVQRKTNPGHVQGIVGEVIHHRQSEIEEHHREERRRDCAFQAVVEADVKRAAAETIDPVVGQA